MDNWKAKIRDHLRDNGGTGLELLDKIRKGIDHLKNKNSPPSTGSEQQSEEEHVNTAAQGDHISENPRGRLHWKLDDLDKKMNFVKALLYGLQFVPKRGSPGLLNESGSDTFCVSQTKDGDCFQAAGLYGSGRVVVFGHNGYLNDVTESPQSELDKRTNRLVLNSVLWAASSECELLSNQSKQCSAICERGNDITSYPLNWGQDCQQPIVVAGLGFSQNKFDSIFRTMSGLTNGLLVKGANYDTLTLETVQSLVSSRPDLIVWVNGRSREQEIIDVGTDLLDPRAEALLYYVQQGGGLVLGICPWGWESLAHVSVADNSIFNQVTSKVGIHLTSDMIYSFDSDGVDVEFLLKAADQPTRIEIMHKSAQQVMTQANVDLATFKDLTETYLSYPASAFLPAQRPMRAWLPESNAKMKAAMQQIELIALNIGQHSLAFPLATGKGATSLTQSTAAAMLYLAWLRRTAETKPPAELRSLVPSLNTFPGSVGQGPRNAGLVTSILNVRRRWQTLGIYAPPGEPLSITISDQSLERYPNLTLMVQIGTHTDRLPLIKDNYKLNRHPRITNVRSWSPREISAVDDACMAKPARRSNAISVGSVYGGIVYLSITEGVDKERETPAAIVFNVVGGAPIPTYSHMKERRARDFSDPLYNIFNESTDSYPYWSSTWEQRASLFTDAPFTDIEGRYVTMTLPAAILQELSQQELWDVMDFWDQMLLHELELSGDIVDFEYSQERLACDQQISAGYMHSGYPVMCFLDIVTPGRAGTRPQLIDLERLKTDPMWGVYHEFGHNRQKNAWTWDEMTEVTVNIFSLYSCYIMNNYTVYDAPWYINQIPNQIAFLRDSSKTYNDYKGDAGIALGGFGVYVQSIANWKIMHDIFRTYRVNNINPSSDNDKINEWIKQTSLAVNQDLRPYYQQWRWPISDSYLSALDRLPKWRGNVLEILQEASKTSRH